jgi:predicted NBD/HSP70 family sugar kinase
MLLRRIFAAKGCSRADLARATGMSRSATSALVEELLEVGLVRETGQGVSRGGRRPTQLAFVDDAFSILGIDLGASHVSVAVCNMRGQVQTMRSAPCPMRDEPLAAMALIRGLTNQVLDELQVAPADLLGAGLAVASPIDPRDPGRLPPLFLPAWKDVDLKQELALPGDPPLLIDNDANMGALAESWWGAGRDGSDLAFIKLGTGIGAGFVLGGQIFRGQGGTAGELGHFVIDPAGPPCVCGLHGCLATFIGTPALIDAARRKRVEHPETLMNRFDLRGLIRGVKDGDRLARAVIEEAAQALGLAVAGLLNLLNPQLVVLGGELSSVGSALLHPLRAAVNQRCVWSAVANSRIVISELGAHDVALGAATLVLQQALDEPTRIPVPWRM